ncbi:hypothetical protein DUNSADRAFT_6055 [Dunaliella salina]|uniref:GINS subunit domain-containing protein n=1 Tax=Dunaliella salina TaxID=3046 RepID=A0ABQ7GP15_DUNSA|nr:hypothetical protein DUNSADRAFT_6055 [Dunaliella salina]|eukprot:KAF5836328.1 hypothetical protein DUNSADRAFT_6055 [Dunaliella salina]
MSAFGKRGVELLKEVVNHEPDMLPSYNEELVRLVFSEIDEHYVQAQRVLSAVNCNQQSQQEGEEEDTGEQAEGGGLQDKPADAVAMVIHYESIARNKRLLLSYIAQRVERLKNVRWQHRELPESVAEACSPQELEFYHKYDQLLTKHMSKHEGIGHDLTLDILPPGDNFVAVRVVRDAGMQLFSSGPLGLHEGACLRLPADEAQPFLISGVLKLDNRKEFI